MHTVIQLEKLQNQTSVISFNKHSQDYTLGFGVIVLGDCPVQFSVVLLVSLQNRFRSRIFDPEKLIKSYNIFLSLNLVRR